MRVFPWVNDYDPDTETISIKVYAKCNGEHAKPCREVCCTMNLHCEEQGLPLVLSTDYTCEIYNVPHEFARQVSQISKNYHLKRAKV